MIYEYQCKKCEHVQEVFHRYKQKVEVQCEACYSFDMVKLVGSLIPLGTRDSFGIKNEFKTPEGVVVDNWKTWEKEGYRNPLEVVRNSDVKKKIKTKMEKVKRGM